VNPRNVAVVGMLLLATSLFWYAGMLSPDVPILWLLLPSAVMGLANAAMWAPISTTVTRNLTPRDAGAGSGVYNTTRQIGAVLGSASIAVLMQARLTAELPKQPGGSSSGGEFGAIGALPEFLHAGFTTAMAQSLLLPASIAILGAVIVMFFAKPSTVTGWDHPRTGSVPTAEPADKRA
jgi:hypothetical protein